MKTHAAATALLLISGFGMGSVSGQSGSDNAGSPWAAHVDVARLRDSPLARILGDTLDLERVLSLRDIVQENLNLEADSVRTATFIGAGEKWEDTAIILHGEFQTLDLSLLPTTRNASDSRPVSIFAPKGSFPLYVSRHSPVELVVGTSWKAADSSLALLDEKKPAWDETGLPDQAKGELSAAIASLFLDMRRIGSELHFEADFTRSIQRVWLLAGNDQEDVELTLLIESNDAEDFLFLNKQLSILTAMVASLENAPPEWQQLLHALRIETRDRWMTVKINAAPAQATRFLQSLALLFKEEVKPGSAPHPSD